MKLLHLSDLHLGKRVNEYSMLEDQRYILREIIRIIDEEKPEGVLIAGDIYDKPVPPAEAVQVFDWFLTELSGRKTPVFVISGNHDSPERLAFGNRLMEGSGVYMAPVYEGETPPVILKDSYGTVAVYMLPFLKPQILHRVWPEDQADTFDEAVGCAVRHITESPSFDPSARNVLIAHQFVTGAACCESEELSVGGLDQVRAEWFEAFDYTALGHIHGPQQFGERIRYCGTPLKYSFSEAGHEKSVTVVELFEKGRISVSTRSLKPLHDMRELKGAYQEVTDRSFYQGTAVDDYLRITLTDEEDILDGMGKLRSIYPNLMRLDYDNRRTRAGQQLETVQEEYTPMELLKQLYELQNNQPMDLLQEEFAGKLMKEIWEELL